MHLAGQSIAKKLNKLVQFASSKQARNWLPVLKVEPNVD